MTEIICNFHQNMVLCKRDYDMAWDAFGFFGGGWSGKSVLSFSLAKLLVERDGFIVTKDRCLTIIDDNFRLENGLIASDGWGGDKTGKCHEFKESLEKLGGCYLDAQPQGQVFKLGSFMGWLIICDDAPLPTITQTDRDGFINKLLGSNPCHSRTDKYPTSPSQEEINASPKIREIIRNTFAVSWDYSIVTRRNTQTARDAPVLDSLALRAYDSWQPIVSRHATPKSEKTGVPETQQSPG